MTRDGGRIQDSIHLPIGGRMNVANALGVYVLLSAFGVSGDEIASGLRTFKGVVRRQQVIGEAAGVTVVDDFAHHPTAIGVTLEAIAERFPGRRILAAFEPRSNTARRNVFQDAFADAFDRASRVYLGPVYFKENDPIAPGERLETGALASAISARGAARDRMRVERRDPRADARRRARRRRRAVHVERAVRRIEGKIPRGVAGAVGARKAKVTGTRSIAEFRIDHVEQWTILGEVFQIVRE